MAVVRYLLLFGVCLAQAFGFVQAQTAFCPENFGKVHNQALYALYCSYQDLPDTQTIIQYQLDYFTSYPVPLQVPLSLTQTLSILQTFDDASTLAYYQIYYPNIYYYLNQLEPYWEVPQYQAHIFQAYLSDECLDAESRTVLGACFSVADSSRAFWEKKMVPIDSTAQHADSLAYAQKVPVGKIVKADVYGLLKGLIAGTMVWFGLEYIKVPRPASILIGAGVGIVIAPIQSALFVRKYRKGKFSKQEIYKEWEIDPRKL